MCTLNQQKGFQPKEDWIPRHSDKSEFKVDSPVGMLTIVPGMPCFLGWQNDVNIPSTIKIGIKYHHWSIISPYPFHQDLSFPFCGSILTPPKTARCQWRKRRGVESRELFLWDADPWRLWWLRWHLVCCRYVLTNFLSFLSTNQICGTNIHSTDADTWMGANGLWLMNFV